MKGTPIDQPSPATLWPPPEPYESASDGWAPPRAAGSAMGTLKVAIPVESCAEKLSPIPWIFPLPEGTEIAWLLTPVLSAPVGSEATCCGSMAGSDPLRETAPDASSCPALSVTDPAFF